MFCAKSIFLLFMKTSGESVEGSKRRKKSWSKTSKSLPLNKQIEMTPPPQIFTKITQEPSHTLGW